VGESFVESSFDNQASAARNQELFGVLQLLEPVNLTILAICELGGFHGFFVACGRIKKEKPDSQVWTNWRVNTVLSSWPLHRADPRDNLNYHSDYTKPDVPNSPLRWAFPIPSKVDLESNRTWSGRQRHHRSSLFSSIGKWRSKRILPSSSSTW
jgi:hypothetical protein